MIGIMGDDDKVRVELQQIQNGFLINRSWCEVTGSGDKQKHEFHSETYYLASLPQLISKMFKKGKNAPDFGGKAQEKEDSYAKSLGGFEFETVYDDETEDEEGDDE